MNNSRTDTFETINECRHMLCLLFREYGIVVRVFDRQSTFHKQFNKLKHKVGVALLKYSEADSIDRRKTGKSWWLSEAYMPLQLELDMHENTHCLHTYMETLHTLLRSVYENLDRGLIELDRRGIQVFGRTGRAARDTVRHEVYEFLEKSGLKPKTSRSWEIHDGLTVAPGGRP